jgi:hypothetical protein
MNEILNLIPLRMLCGVAHSRLSYRKAVYTVVLSYTINSREKCRQCLNVKERSFNIDFSHYIASKYCWNEVHLICYEFVSSCIMTSVSAKMF